MVARGRRVGRRVRVLGEWAPAAPRREDIAPADLEVVGEVAPHLVEKVLDLVLGDACRRDTVAVRIQGLAIRAQAVGPCASGL